MLKLNFFKFEYNIRNQDKDFHDGVYGKTRFQQFLIFSFSAFIVTPLTIIYWAAAWDVIYIYLFPEDPLFSCFVSGAISKSFLFIFYMFQEYMQAAHDAVFRKNQFLAYLMRMFYAFILCFVYVLQYRSYWDTYNEYTKDIDYKYFFGLAIVTIIAYRYMLDGNFSSYCKTVPLEVSVDDNYEAFFLQGKFIRLKNKWLQKIANYFYFEWLEMLISIFVWKGVYDVVETGVIEMFKPIQPNPDKEYWIALIFTGVLSYGFFFLFTLFKGFIRFQSEKVFKKFSHFFLDFIDFLAYWSMVGCWEFIWDFYDVFLYDSGYIAEEWQGPFAILSVVVIFLIAAVLGLVGNLFGPAGSVDEDEEEENEPTVEHRTVRFNRKESTIVEKF